MLTPEQRDLATWAHDEMVDNGAPEVAEAIRQVLTDHSEMRGVITALKTERDRATGEVARLVAENVQLLHQAIELSARVKSAPPGRTSFTYYVTFDAMNHGQNATGMGSITVANPIRTYEHVKEIGRKLEGERAGLSSLFLLSWTLLDES